MTLDELIEQLRVIRIARGTGQLPVIMCTNGSTGDCDYVEAALNPDTGKPEVWLQEKL
jgi:hypothetical protein